MSQPSGTDRIAVVFSCPLPPKGLRRNSLTRNHQYSAKLKREYSKEAFWCYGDQLGGFPYNCAWEKAEIAYVWHSIQPVDEDNITGNCKSLTDALRCRELGVKLVRVKGERIFLDELPMTEIQGRLEDIGCGPECASPPQTGGQG